MSKNTINIIVLLLCFFIFSSSLNVKAQDCEQLKRYKVDFDVVFNNPSSESEMNTIICKINLKELEKFRKESERVEITNSDLNAKIILYSYQEIKLVRNIKIPIHTEDIYKRKME